MNIIKLSAILLSIAFLYGCASGAKMENMIYDGTSIDKSQFDRSLKQQVSVDTVSGGEETNPMWTSEISNEAFSGAVKQSLNNMGLLAPKGRYQLNVKLLNVDQPLFGFDMTVTTNVQYTLTDIKTGRVIFDRKVSAAHTATVSDAFVAITRLRLANEGSGKKNIEALLKHLLRLKIKPGNISMMQ